MAPRTSHPQGRMARKIIVASYNGPHPPPVVAHRSTKSLAVQNRHYAFQLAQPFKRPRPASSESIRQTRHHNQRCQSKPSEQFPFSISRINSTRAYTLRPTPRSRATPRLHATAKPRPFRTPTTTRPHPFTVHSVYSEPSTRPTISVTINKLSQVQRPPSDRGVQKIPISSSLDTVTSVTSTSNRICTTVWSTHGHHFQHRHID